MDQTFLTIKLTGPWIGTDMRDAEFANYLNNIQPSWRSLNLKVELETMKATHDTFLILLNASEDMNLRCLFITSLLYGRVDPLEVYRQLPDRKIDRCDPNMKWLLNPEAYTETLAELEVAESPRPHRRGRGNRRNDAYWKAFNASDVEDPFDGRECLFEGKNGRITMPALANLDTGLKVPGGLIMSSHYAKEIGRYQDISTDMSDPCLRSITGQHTPVTGILRDVVFRLKGSSVTFMRDFFVCDAIDGLVDIMLGAQFIKDQFQLLFEKIKGWGSMFAWWFATKKESEEEKVERERREREQRVRAEQREIAKLRRELEGLEARQRARSGQSASLSGQRS